mmetsp:Transcript_21608/g.69772  ORF Transcript_21608/g.69772 Transcript_21608/m.69772 type:complete len:204 (+) Transcript_21608:834-1445(+)
MVTSGTSPNFSRPNARVSSTAAKTRSDRWGAWPKTSGPVACSAAGTSVGFHPSVLLGSGGARGPSSWSMRHSTTRLEMRLAKPEERRSWLAGWRRSGSGASRSPSTHARSVRSRLEIAACGEADSKEERHEDSFCEADCRWAQSAGRAARWSERASERREARARSVSTSGEDERVARSSFKLQRRTAPAESAARDGPISPASG